MNRSIQTGQRTAQFSAPAAVHMVTNRKHGLLFLFSWLAFVLSASVAAQPAPTWLMHQDASTIYLQFGTPQSDFVVISFSCEQRESQMRIIEFIRFSQSRSPPAGLYDRPAMLKLTAGAASVEYRGELTINEMGRTANVVVVGAPDPKLFALLRAGPTLRIDVEGASETIPLQGITASLPEFERACLGPI